MDIDAGVTPWIRLASPIVSGRYCVNFDEPLLTKP